MKEEVTVLEVDSFYRDKESESRKRVELIAGIDWESISKYVEKLLSFSIFEG